MFVKYEVSVVVEVDDDDGRIDEDFLTMLATHEAAVLLTRRAEGFDDPEVVIHVLEVP